MKKIFYILLALVVFGIYSCQKDNTAPAKKANTLNATMKLKKDTTPPELFKKSVRDTTPPELFRRTVRDTTPPELLK